MSGHFCIFSKESEVIDLPQFVYEQLQIDLILLLEADVEIVNEHLFKRDSKIYAPDKILLLKNNENELSNKVSKQLNIEMINILMQFDGSDSDRICDLIIKQGGEL